jgi:dienelactone hydrolase
MSRLLRHLAGGFAMLAVAVPEPAKPYELTVRGGSGGGGHAANALVHIWANPNPPGAVFDRWTGDVDKVVDRYAAHTILVMPPAKIAITAVFKRAPAWKPSAETLDGVHVLSYVPPRHSGAIVLFHGNGGGADAFLNAVEARIFAADAVAAGYGLIALDSADRERKVWNQQPSPDNPDVRRVKAVLAAFVQRRQLKAGEPIYALGVASGGAFAAKAAFLLNFHAAAIYFAPGDTSPGSRVPTIWLMAQNDQLGKANRNGDPRALANFSSLVAKGVAAKFNINDPSPVYPLRFWRIPGLQPADSTAIYQGLHEHGLLDAGGFLRDHPKDSPWRAAIPERFARQAAAIREQLDVCFSAHRFYSDFDNRVIDFFNEHH